MSPSTPKTRKSNKRLKTGRNRTVFPSGRNKMKSNDWTRIPKERRQSVGAKIRRTRKRKNLSEDQVSELTGLSKAEIGRIERGEFTNQPQIFLLSYLSHLGLKMKDVGL